MPASTHPADHMFDESGLQLPFADGEAEDHEGASIPLYEDAFQSFNPKTGDRRDGEQLAWLDLEQPAWEAESMEHGVQWAESSECENGCARGSCGCAHEDEGPHGFDPGAFEAEEDEEAFDPAFELEDEAQGPAERGVLEAMLESETGAGTALADRVKGVAEFVMGPTLRRGSRGAGVATLQRALVALGHDLAVDGSFGPNTERTVRAFQGRAGLVIDGIVGPATKSAIAAALGGKAPSPAPSPVPVPPPAPTPTPSNPDVEAFATRLGTEWSRRESGKRSPEVIRDQLLVNYQDTLQGARKRFGNKYTEDVLRRAWMISREDQMRFKTEQPGVRELGPLPKPPERTLISDRSIGGSDKAPVAPIMVRFFAELRRRYPRVSATNYATPKRSSNHDRGYALDLWLNGLDARGFYPQDEAIKLLRAVDGAAKALHAHWRVIYNDFAVAATINRETGRHNVIFVGDVRRDGKLVTGLNWHGPAPLILHFHIDLWPGPSTPQGEYEWNGDGEAEWLREDEGPTPPLFGPTLRAGDRGAAVQELQQSLSKLGDGLAVDGIFGPDTARAVRAFQSRSGLIVDGVVGPATKAALAAALGGAPITPPSPLPMPPPLPPPARRKLTPAELVATYGPYARAEQATHGVPALVTLGQFAIESGWGAKAVRNNPFGIKARPTDPTRQLLRTKEVYPTSDHRSTTIHPTTYSVTQRADGKWVHDVDAWFRTYPSMQAAFDSHGRVLRHPRYARAFVVATDPYAFGREVARAGYSTDPPAYEKLLVRVMQMIEAAGGP